jgi:hypothetical protein
MLGCLKNEKSLIINVGKNHISKNCVLLENAMTLCAMSLEPKFADCFTAQSHGGLFDLCVSEK